MSHTVQRYKTPSYDIQGSHGSGKNKYQGDTQVLFMTGRTRSDIVYFNKLSTMNLVLIYRTKNYTTYKTYNN